MTRALLRSRSARAVSLLRRLARDRGGVSAVEFALLAPFLVLATFSAADAGMAAYDRMMIDQVLRAGAQLAIAGEDEDAIRAALEATAAENFSSGGDAAGGQLSIVVESYCLCPGEGDGSVGCATVCASGAAANLFYRLTAVKTFDGVMLPDFTLSGTLEVMAG